jgi:hypothetical protein
MLANLLQDFGNRRPAQSAPIVGMGHKKCKRGLQPGLHKELEAVDSRAIRQVWLPDGPPVFAQRAGLDEYRRWTDDIGEDGGAR